MKESGSIAVSGRFPPRIFRRVPFEAELRLRWEPDGGEVSARIANISLGGMFVVSGEPRPAGTTLELSFKLPEQPAPVRGRGRVAWVRERDEGLERPPGMGVRFLELTPGSRELIDRLGAYQAASGMSVGVPTDGGYLVRSDWSAALLTRAREAAVLLPRCRSIEIGGDFDGLEYPYIDESSRVDGSRWGGVQVYRKAEAATVTAKQP